MKIYLIAATIKDVDLLFSWINDEAVRRNAFKTDMIQYEKHKNWLKEKLASAQTIIYIAYLEETPIGQIRLDIESGTGLIDYSVAKEHRGKGYGTLLLIELFNYIQKKDLAIKKLVGRVKLSNLSSQKVFEKAHYASLNKDDCIEYYKVI